MRHFIASSTNWYDKLPTTEKSVSIDVNINGSEDTEDSSYNEDYVMGRMIILTSFPAIFVFGTIGNLLSIIVMQRGSLKHSSTCFYVAMLAVADTCKFKRIFHFCLPYPPRIRKFLYMF